MAGHALRDQIPVFHPTLAEMADFPAYIRYIESQGADKIGLAKVGGKCWGRAKIRPPLTAPS
jgi:hypothetical protein